MIDIDAVSGLNIDAYMGISRNNWALWMAKDNITISYPGLLFIEFGYVGQ